MKYVACLAFLAVIIPAISLAQVPASSVRGEPQKQTASQRDASNQRMIDAAATATSEALSALRDGGERSFEQELLAIEDYLREALWLIYFGKVRANLFEPEHLASTNADLGALDDLGLIPFWPENPITGQPMRVLASGGTFSPGDVVFELCPASHYSGSENGLAPLSFNVYVLAPSDSTPHVAQISIAPSNDTWATIPKGALYSHSLFVESEQQRLARNEAIAEKLSKDKDESERPAEK
jgi:hypothetical protein